MQPVLIVPPGKNLDYDPHLDPQLVWAGKKEHTSFEVPTVSQHVHGRIDHRTIGEAVRKLAQIERPSTRTQKAISHVPSFGRAIKPTYFATHETRYLRVSLSQQKDSKQRERICPKGLTI